MNNGKITVLAYFLSWSRLSEHKKEQKQLYWKEDRTGDTKVMEVKRDGWTASNKDFQKGVAFGLDLSSSAVESGDYEESRLNVREPGGGTDRAGQTVWLIVPASPHSEGPGGWGGTPSFTLLAPALTAWFTTLNSHLTFESFSSYPEGLTMSAAVEWTSFCRHPENKHSYVSC